MRARLQIPDTVIRLASEQAGVLSREQAFGLGFGRKPLYRLLDEQQWGTLEPGIFLVPNIPPSWMAHVWAGILVGGPESRAAGLTAAALHGLSDGRTLPVDILVPNGRRPVARSWAVFQQERDRVRGPSTRAQPPRLRIEDTVLDLCAIGSGSACIDWVTTAVQRRLTTPEALLVAMAARRRVPHRRLLEELLTDVASGVHSTLEYRYLHQVERAHGLPAGTRQRARPGRNGFIDVVYEKFALAVELDGRLGHVGSTGGVDSAFRDRRRDNSHTRVGLRSLRFGWHEITQEPCAVALDVAEVLIGSGWRDLPTRCPDCR